MVRYIFLYCTPRTAASSAAQHSKIISATGLFQAWELRKTRIQTDTCRFHPSGHARKDSRSKPLAVDLFYALNNLKKPCPSGYAVSLQ